MSRKEEKNSSFQFQTYFMKFQDYISNLTRDGVLIVVLVLVLTRVLFSVLSCTLYFAKFMSICTRTYLSTVTKKPVLMSTLRVLLNAFF